MQLQQIIARKATLSQDTRAQVNIRSYTWYEPESLERSPLLSPEQDEFLVYVEAAGTLVFDLRRSFLVTDVFVSFATFYRSITGKSVVGSTINLFDSMAQSLSDYLPFFQSNTGWIEVLDDFHKNMHRVANSALGKKLISVFNHVVAHTFYHKMGIEVDSHLFHKIEQGHIRVNCWNVLTFSDAIVGLLLFLAKAGRQALLTGSADPFFVDSDVVGDWIVRASRLRKDAEFLGNPGAVGIETPHYLNEVASAIEDGKKIAIVYGDYQKTLINNIILELEMIQKRHISSLAASSFRWCPVGINLYGDAGVGKSFLATGLFNHYCSVRGVKKERATLYPRNPDDKYYSGYKSHYMGVIYDDVAKHKSNKVMGIDQSLTDLISAINNIPLITAQAEACDKGKIPFLSEWVGITSNIHDLSVGQYYNNTYAVLRRLPYRIEPVVKAAFRKPGSTKIDPSKIPAGEQYPDCWRFRVCEAVQHTDEPLIGYYSDNATVYESYSDLLKWLTSFYESHIKNQELLLKTVGEVGPEQLCKCHLPVSLCQCDEIAPMIFGSVAAIIDAPIAQVNQTTDAELVSEMLDEFATERIEAVLALRREMRDKYKHLQGLERMYSLKWWQRGLPEEATQYVFDKHYTVPSLIAKLREDFETDIVSFKTLSARGKAFAITNAASRLPNGDSYLTFVPRKGGKRNYLRSHLATVYSQILDYVDVAGWDEKQKAALELYVYEKVPGYIADGWDDDSILHAAFDYVDEFATVFVPQERQDAEAILMADADKVSLRDKICRYVGLQYFTRPWLFKSVNWVITTRPGAYVTRVAADFFLSGPKWQMASLMSSAAAYDFRLKGRHPVVKLIVVVCSSALLVTIVAMAFKFLIPKKQVAITELGKKPTVREVEKKNVWHVEEPNITELDFLSGRRNCKAQLVPALVKNSVLIEFVGKTDRGTARGTTRGLIINNSQLVLNSHACIPGTMTVFFHKKTKEGPQAKFVIELEESMITRHELRDIAIVRSMAIPALFADISKNLVRKTFSSVGASYYHIPQEDGNALELPVFGARKHPLTGFQGSRSGVNMQAYAGRPQEPTKSGDCGSPLVMSTGHGPVIVGIHCAYNPVIGSSFAAPIFYEDFHHEPMVVAGVVTPSMPVAQVKVVGNKHMLEPSDKLFSNYHEDGHLITFGQLQGFRPRMKASGGKTEIADWVLTEGVRRGLSPKDNLSLPDMGSWEPQQNILREYLNPTHSMKESLFRVGCESFVEHLRRGLSLEDKDDMHPVPLSVAVNGYPGVPNVDAQKFTTSAGHGRNGCKAKYVDYDGPRDEWGRFREYDLEVNNEVQKIYDLACQGVRSHPIFTAQLKNEMVSHAKKLAKKTRGFYMCPLGFLTAIRLLTTGITRVMVRRKHLFRHAVGLNTHSDEWDDLFQRSNEIPGNNWMAGDFKGFDKILSILIQNGGKFVFLELAKMGGFSDEELLALDTMLSDTITPVVDFFGTLIMLLGGEVSGHQVTTFFNSICNVLLHLYAWIELGVQQGYSPQQAGTMFWYMVFICVLGDDIMAKISEGAPWYNHTTVQAVFASIGIQYTMADKLSESVPYIPYSQVTFLKRRFANHEEFPGMMVAPLEQDSIYKMLIYTIPSKTVSKEVQLAQSICSAQAEAFYHGRKFFDALVGLISEAPKSDELEMRMLEFPAPSWEQMKERFWRASPNYRGSLVNPEHECAEAMPALTDSYCQHPGTESQASWRVDPWGSTTMGRSPEDSVQSSDRLSTNNFLRRRQIEKTAAVEDDFLTKNFRKVSKVPSDAHGQMAPAFEESAISNKFRQKRYRRRKAEDWASRTVAQADVSMDSRLPAPISGAVDKRQQTTLFKSEPVHEKIDMSQSTGPIASSLKMPQGIADYFARPKLIDTFTWTEAMGTGVQKTSLPWGLFLGSQSMKDKLQGFSLLRGNLCLKFIINGSPFYYGGLMAAYTPFSIDRSDTAVGAANLLLVAASQKPHVWLNVQETSTTEMKLPFLYPFPFVDTQLIANFNNLGKLDLIVYSGLRSANGVTGSAVDVQIFAWMEDLELAGPSDQAIAQADMEYQDDHQISDMASTVANVAGKLKWVPGLAPYATATEAAARVAGSVANFFGYTNVPNINDVQPVKQLPFSLASTSISEPVTKLSLQPKQEIAIGSTQFGAPEDDDLAMDNFIGKESFLVGSLWSTTMVPNDPIFTSAVLPYMAQTSATAIAYTPLGYISQFFQWWRGSIIFRFKVIRSPYHRGRIQIGWDRAANDLSEGPIIGNANTYNVVMDLDEDDEVEMEIPWSQYQQFLTNYGVNGLPTNLPYSTSATPSGSWTRANGVLSVRVMNRLTAPEASSDVTLLCFVRAGKEFDFAGPVEFDVRNGNNTLSLSSVTASVAQSNIEYEGAETETAALMETPETPLVFKEVFGEKITSLREFLHRSSLSKIHQFAGAATDATYRYRVPIKRIPMAPGVFNNGWDFGTTTSGAGQYVNYCKFHPITALAACFIGYKGSVNITANISEGNSSTATYTDDLAISRRSYGASASAADRRPYVVGVTAASSAAITADSLNEYAESGVTGMALTNTKTNAGLSANLPYYASSGFMLFDMRREYNNTQTLTDNGEDWWVLGYTKSSANVPSTRVHLYYAAGPDFDLTFFINVPILTLVSITPV